MNERDDISEPGEAFEPWAQKRFDESVDRLDAATLSRLNRGRQAALAAAKQPARQWSTWMPATGVAVAVLVAVIVMRGAGIDGVIEAPAADFEILLSEENIDLFEELEFYRWLDAAELEADGDVG